MIAYALFALLLPETAAINPRDLVKNQNDIGAAFQTICNLEKINRIKSFVEYSYRGSNSFDRYGRIPASLTLEMKDYCEDYKINTLQVIHVFSVEQNYLTAISLRSLGKPVGFINKSLFNTKAPGTRNYSMSVLLEVGPGMVSIYEPIYGEIQILSLRQFEEICGEWMFIVER